MSDTSDLLLSSLASAARLGMGVFSNHRSTKPEKPLELYEFEACPFCRKAREAFTTVDLDVMVYPCPKGGTVYRPRVKEMGGKEQFPYLVDPNTGDRMYESDDIIAYLFENYGKGNPGLFLKGPLANASSFLASAARPSAGVRVRPSKRPAKPLELYSFDASPFSRIVRETLCELEIPYLLHNVGKASVHDWLPPALRSRFTPNTPFKSENRRNFVARSGKMQVPYLIDPNTGAEMFESVKIRKYLLDTYAA
ncbi:MAG: glutathione S-transferase N-terminal domain-containing protein [Bdellovibrionota bacterium]